MFRTIGTVAWGIWHIRPVSKVLWRNALGRFHVFRDAPDGVVDYFADFSDVMADFGDEASGLKRLVQEAAQEKTLRQRQKQRRAGW